MYHDPYCSRCNEKIELEVDGIITHGKTDSVSAKLIFTCECTTIEPSIKSIDNVPIRSDLPDSWKSKTEPDKFDDIVEYNE